VSRAEKFPHFVSSAALMKVPLQKNFIAAVTMNGPGKNILINKQQFEIFFTIIRPSSRLVGVVDHSEN
jgi:hypothetical protein